MIADPTDGQEVVNLPDIAEVMDLRPGKLIALTESLGLGNMWQERISEKTGKTLRHMKQVDADLLAFHLAEHNREAAIRWLSHREGKMQ